MDAVHKVRATAEVGETDEYVLSDETVDRYGDVIKLSGWRLANFKRNPIVLFNHDNDFPIGRWENVRIEGGALRAKYAAAARGTSPRIDEINNLREQGILKATSVGFKPVKAEPRAGGIGLSYEEQELLECSIVSVPANPNALHVAKSLGVSDDTIRLVFGKQASEHVTRSAPGKQAPPSQPHLKGTRPMRLSERITDAREKLVGYQDQLRSHLDEIGEEPDEAANAVTDELNERVENHQKTVESLEKAERALAHSSQPIAETGGKTEQRPFATPAKKVEPIDYVFRALTVAVKAHIERRPMIEVLKSTYGEDVATKAVTDMVIKAATVPADTQTPAWAGALVQTAVGDFFDLLLPQSVYPGLSARGGRFGFGRNGSVSLPTRSATPTVAGSFVGEGAPIPVRQAGFTSVTLTPKKMAVITTMTREITERSTPAIEQLLRNAIQEDTAVAIDSVLLDASAATTVRPAGLRNGAATAAGTAGGGFAAVVADVKAMVGALIASTNGNIRAPTWLMNPVQALGASLTQNAGGDFIFQGEINQGRFQGYPLIQSTTVPAGTVILIDAADFFSATGDDPRFDVSDQAVLHMEDTAPAQIATAGTVGTPPPNVVAAPVRSMFQTDSLALRMILPMNWALRRSGVVVERTAVTW